MGRIRFSVFAWTFAALVVSCVGDDPQTTSVPTADGGTTTTPDDAAPATEGGASDGSIDAPSDAPTDAAPPSFCSTQAAATFCADFEASLKPDDGWEPAKTVGNGVVELISLPVRGVRMLIPEAVSVPNNHRYAVLQKSFPLTTERRFVLELSMRPGVATVAPGGLLRYFVVLINGGPGVFGLYRRDTGWHLFANWDGGAYESPPLTNVPSPNVFTRIKLDVKLAANNTGSARLDVDGVQSHFRSGQTLGSAQTGTLNANLQVGAYQAIAPTPSLEVAFDDVTMTVLP